MLVRVWATSHIIDPTAGSQRRWPLCSVCFLCFPFSFSPKLQSIEGREPVCGPIYLLPSSESRDLCPCSMMAPFHVYPRSRGWQWGAPVLKWRGDGGYREASDSLSVSAAQTFGGVPLLKEPSLPHLKSAQTVTGSPDLCVSLEDTSCQNIEQFLLFFEIGYYGSPS